MAQGRRTERFENGTGSTEQENQDFLKSVDKGEDKKEEEK
jgi:hypothetical protein